MLLSSQGLGWIGYENPDAGRRRNEPERAKIFFHFSEIQIPDSVLETGELRTLFSKNSWRSTKPKKGAKGERGGDAE